MKNTFKKFVVIIVMITIVVLGVKAQNTYADVKGPTEDSIIYKHISPKDTDFSNVKLFTCQIYGGIKSSGNDAWLIEQVGLRYKNGKFDYNNVKNNIHYKRSKGDFSFIVSDSLIWSTEVTEQGNQFVDFTQTFKRLITGTDWTGFDVYGTIDTTGVIPGDTLQIEVTFTLFYSGKGTLYFTLPAQYLIYGEKKNVDGIKAIEKPEVKVYPNPFANQITIDGNFKNVTLTNLMGQIMYQGDQKTIETSKLQSGIYFLNIDNQCTKKIIKK